MRLLLLALCITMACTTPDTQMQRFYIGTYTDNGSNGIYSVTFDPQKGEISGPDLAATTENPSFLTFAGDDLVVVNESQDGVQTGGVTLFSQNSDGTLSEVDKANSLGQYPCYISFVKDQKTALVANYGSGNVVSFRVNGQLEVVSNVQQQGTGPDSSRQEGPHAHFITQHRNGFIYAADLGADKIFIYALEEGALELQGEYEAEPGSGPRHLSFHPTLPIAYLINELNSTITVLSIETDGMLETRQQVSTLPQGWKGESYCADIHVHPDGNLLFGSNRGHDSIVSFQIEEDGRIGNPVFFTEGVSWPRNFAISPDGKSLIIANQYGNTVTATRINPEDGSLSKKSEIEVFSPVCILFDDK